MEIREEYNESMERPDGDKCPKCGSRSALLTKALNSFCQKCGYIWL